MSPYQQVRGHTVSGAMTCPNWGARRLMCVYGENDPCEYVIGL
ncbi:hypothetical protein HMPREF1979_01940 [Actinomyces johnsonii F0542]|uniref:Uncharacterized protein n=1 Tax=Actinomyces johnsonii F0542 TaxID=1321818 RepID=U1RTY3_9ACTO|nr:hypothetical protein HMPREF1979_01940 [Actinomyces johnsonii F0542]